MDGYRIPDRRSLLAVLAGAAAAAALYLPPMGIAARLDWGLLDLWARLAPPTAPVSLVLVESDSPGALEQVLTLAERGRARLIVSTHPEPPQAALGAHVLGPTELPVGDRVLRRTLWPRGGHLWFPNGAGGKVRSDLSTIPDSMPVRSLAAAAAAALDQALPPLDDEGRQWLRFHEPRSFARVDPTAHDTAAEGLAGKIVIVGSSQTPHQTPLGPMSSAALVAQALAGRLSGLGISVAPAQHSAAWLLALALTSLLVLRAPLEPVGALFAASGAGLGLIGGMALAYLELGVALPVTAPVAFVLVTAAALTRRAPPQPSLGRLDATATPVEARRLVADGQLVEAAHAYRTLPLSIALLPEQYELAEALENAHEDSQALALYHRIAQTDVRFRDVARRLAGRGTDAVTPWLVEESLGRYELIELIGQGTTGQVYLGRDPKINRLLAIKVINMRGDGSPEANASAAENFCREAESAGRLNHANIVTIYDVGERDGLAYIAMEYLKGRHLSDYCDQDTLLPIDKVLDLLAITADALDYAHARSVVHRDIKPANIMYDSILDELKITDFGIARLIDVNRTRTGIVLGTPSYMAPEQLEGENVNGHTDLFALGVTLYQLLTGRLPFRGASMTKLMFVIANEPHQPVTALRPGLPNGVNGIVDRALAKRPTERFATGAEMADALRSVAASTV